MVLPGLQRSGVVTIPRSAVLATGKRVIAFVRMDDGMLAPREIVTGLTSDDRVEVLSGLAAGDVVVASATFLVDAESNLGAALGAMQGMDMGAPPSRAATPDTAMPGMGSIPGTRMDRGAADSARKPSPSEPHVHPPE
jgi:Cu(I)/Ag(I) efflux system membrane fusion protein